MFDLWDYCSFIAPLQIALAQENVNDSIALLKSMLAAMLTPWDMKKSSLYRHIAVKANQENFGAQVLPALLSEIENDPKYAFLHSNAEFQQLIKQYRAKCLKSDSKLARFKYCGFRGSTGWMTIEEMEEELGIEDV